MADMVWVVFRWPESKSHVMHGGYIFELGVPTLVPREMAQALVSNNPNEWQKNSGYGKVFEIVQNPKGGEV